MTFWDDCGGVLGDFGMLLRALAGLGSSSKSSVFVMNQQGMSGTLSRSTMQGESVVWEA